MTVRTIEAQPAEKKKLRVAATTVSVRITMTSGKAWKRRRHIMKRGSGCIPTGSTLAYFMISASPAQKQMSVTACRRSCTNAVSDASIMC